MTFAQQGHRAHRHLLSWFNARAPRVSDVRTRLPLYNVSCFDPDLAGIGGAGGFVGLREVDAASAAKAALYLVLGLAMVVANLVFVLVLKNRRFKKELHHQVN